MKTYQRTWLALAILFAPALAGAEPSIEIKDRGDYEEIIAHGVKSTKTAISPIRQRLEIPLAGVIAVKRVIPKGDPTVQLAEVDNESHVLSVKLTMEHKDVAALAKSAQAMQIGDDLHLIFPRKVPADPASVTLPEPTLPVIVPPPAPAIAPPVIAPNSLKPVEAKAPETKPDGKIDTKIDAKIDAKPEVKPIADVKADDLKPAPGVKLFPMKPEAGSAVEAAADAGSGASGSASNLGTKKTPPKAIGTVDDAGGPLTTSIALGLAAVAGIYWLVKRRKAGATAAPSTIDIIAQRSLGGRAKIVWLSAGGRDMIVAVTAQNVRMLGQWPRGEAKRAFGSLASTPAPREPDRDLRTSLAARAPRLAEGTDPGVTTPAAASDAPAAVSPAIQGLMRLRQQREPLPAATRSKRDSFVDFQMNEEVATDDLDADAMWAKEILAATAGRTR